MKTKKQKNKGVKKDWLVLYDKKKNEYFAVEDKHKEHTPNTIGDILVIIFPETETLSMKTPST